MSLYAILHSLGFKIQLSLKRVWAASPNASVPCRCGGGRTLWPRQRRLQPPRHPQQGSQDTGAGVARSWRGLLAVSGLDGAGLACDPTRSRRCRGGDCGTRRRRQKGSQTTQYVPVSAGWPARPFMHLFRVRRGHIILMM
eukprot:gene11855-biopygen361